jgi:hypothetical protein
MTKISRRTLIQAGAAASVATAATAAPTLLGADAAQAKIRNDAAVRQFGPVAIIGDSSSAGFLSGLNTQLTKAGVGPYRYDIKGSRRITKSWLKYDSGVRVVEKMKASGFDPPAWVVALGSNDFYFFRRNLLSPTTEISTLLDLIGPDKQVAWFTIWTKRAGKYHSTFNEQLLALAAQRPNLIVRDWASIAIKNPKWLMADGAHLRMPGARARNLFIAESAVAACQAAGAVTPPA